MASRADAIPMGGTAEYGIWRVILASAVGTMIEWYDFYIFGSLAAVLSPIFYGAQATAEVSISRWWRVVGGLSMNLALGSLYAWSVFVAPLEKEFGWK